MKQLFLRIIRTRTLAAVAGVGTSAIAVWQLPSTEYALASVALSYSAVATISAYLPFSRFALVCGIPQAIFRPFIRAQAFVVPLIVVAAIGTALLSDMVSASLAAVATVLVVSQGIKELVGELLRLEVRLAEYGAVYLGDAVTTLALTCLALYNWPTAEAYLLSSALSTIAWVMPVLRSFKGVPDQSIRLAQVYSYAAGPVGSNAINGGTIATVRTLLLSAGDANLVAGTQFLLDVLQKPMALFSSTLNSVIIPVAKSKLDISLAFRLIGALTGALVALLVLAVALLLGGTQLGIIPAELPLASAASCAVFVWCNRYKTSLMDLSLVADLRSAKWLLAGALTSAALVLCLTASSLRVTHILVLSSLFVLMGGGVNLVASTSLNVGDRRATLAIGGVSLIFAASLVSLL